MRWLLFGASVCALFLSGSCAGTECNYHSQCERGHFCSMNRCVQECMIDEDCERSSEVCNVRIGRCEPPDASVADGGGRDAGPGDARVPPADAWMPGLDAGRDAGGADAGPRDAGADAGPVAGTGQYLDRCTSDADCAGGPCVPDVGGSRFCSRACTAHAMCAHEHVCDGARCVPDDTGRPCSTATPATCSLGLCLGPAGGTGACTRPCASASECPAGYACTEQGGMHVCVDIETPCAGPSECLTGLCLSVQGCTSTCRTAADCPARLAGLPPYRCELAFGSPSPICVPPADIIGNQAAGDLCDYDPGTGLVLCRSGACDDGAPLGPTCTQACTAEGGCGPGLGCFPLADGGDITLVCSRAGSGALGDPCTSASQCDSALCDATSGRCTRLCSDGLCPTTWTCEPVAGFGLAICRP